MKQIWYPLIIVVISCILKSEEVDIELRRFYRIQNADLTFLTVGGDSKENVKMITTTPTTREIVNPKLQSFWIGSRVGFDQAIYEISPAAQNTAISLVLEENTDIRLLYQQIRHFRNTQWWRILDAGNDKWQIINDRSNLCLVSRGSGMQVGTDICDLSVGNQTWTFTIERKGDSFP